MYVYIYTCLHIPFFLLLSHEQRDRVAPQGFVVLGGKGDRKKKEGAFRDRTRIGAATSPHWRPKPNEEQPKA
jgi:hypothetical protein